MLRKHGIDLGDSNGIADGRKTKRMDPKEIEMLMGGGEGQGGIFTWREKNRRKVSDECLNPLWTTNFMILYIKKNSWPIPCKYL